MKSKKISILLAGIMSLSILVNPFTSNEKKVNATEIVTTESSSITKINDSQTANASLIATNGNYVYLSDLNHDSKSTTGHKQIMKNSTTDGNTIRLLVNNEVVSFKKGMGVHANSNLIYDVSQYSSTYSRFVSDIGVDYSQIGKGNGVLFTIFTSSDGIKWNIAKDIGVLTPNQNSVHVDLNIQGVKYIKLVANTNGNISNDHAVYGNARLVKKDYDINSELYNEYQPLKYYDEILSKQTPDTNYIKNKKLILKREFINRVGYQTIQNSVADSSEIKTALDWLAKDEDALQLFIEAGSLLNGSGAKTLSALGSLYAKYKDSLGNTGDSYVYKKMLIATAVANCKDIRPYIVAYGGNSVSSDPVKKFQAFKDLYDQNKLLNKEQFKNYNMELIRYVMDAKIDDQEIKWLRNYSEYKYPTDMVKRLNGYSYVNYKNIGYNSPDLYSSENKSKWDEKYKLSANGVTYGEASRYRLWMMMEKGGICWGISGMGVNVNEVHGRPATSMYQPGHEAYLLYNQDDNGIGTWQFWNGVGNWSNSFSRWGGSTNTETRILLGWGCKPYNNFNKNNGSYILLAQAALNKYDAYKESFFYNLIANSYANNDSNREVAYNKALSLLNINLDSFDGLLDYYKATNKSSTEWLKLAERITNAYAYYPLPMAELLDRISPQITNEKDLLELSLLKNTALTKAKNATTKDSLQPDACKVVANSLLGQTSTEVATFSFTGDDANHIKLDSSYDGINLVVKYSLDGGTTWLESESHKIKLTDDQLKSISSDKDILVSFVGSNAAYTIDIQKGAKANNSTLYKNDLENKLIGKTDYLQYSLDDGETWNDYNSNITFDGNKVVQVRYKSNGIYTISDVTQYSFNADSTDPKKKYINIKHLSIEGSSSTANDKDIATNIINGTENNGWYSKSQEGNFVTIKLDSVKYITSLEYMSKNNNGKLKSGEIFTSLDGQKWESSGTFSGLTNDQSFKTIKLNKPTATKYVKIVAKESYGNTANTFSCNMINLYEDTTQGQGTTTQSQGTTQNTTQTNEVAPTVTYSTKNRTNGNVTATINIQKEYTLIGENSYTFTKNGAHTFKYKLADGTEKSFEVKVDWIDRTAPKVTVEYDVSQDGKSVIARIADADEEIININTKDGSKVLTDNNIFTFQFKDKAGNIGYITANTNWITNNSSIVNFTKDSNGNVKASLNLNSSLEVVNNNKKSEYIFTENGTFVFKVKNTALGRELLIPVKVTSIVK